MRVRAIARGSIAGSLILLAASLGCAHVEAPPGGPEDRTAPELLASRPGEGEIVQPFSGPVRFTFSERISERGVEDAVTVSPRTSPVSISPGREEIRVTLRDGWVANTIYHLWIAPTVVDLFGNALEEPITVVFSTGPAIPATIAEVDVVDRITGRPTADLRVEAILLPDSLVYTIPPDSLGVYRIEQIPEGEYLIRAFEDLNRNRALDPSEPRDSARAEVRIDAPVEIALSIVAPDSTPPVARTATVRQGRIELEFDDYLDPEQEITLDQVSVAGPGGSIALQRAAIGALPEIVPDSILAADSIAPVPPAPAAPRLPSRVLIIEPAPDAELEPGADYEVRAERIRNLVGLEGGGEVTLTIPEEPGAPAGAP